MVKIIDYKSRENKEGERFFVLVLQGDVTPVKSAETGRMYFTAKRATASCTFDEETCKKIYICTPKLKLGTFLLSSVG